jgi:hypothetical protein
MIASENQKDWFGRFIYGIHEKPVIHQESIRK